MSTTSLHNQPAQMAEEEENEELAQMADEENEELAQIAEQENEELHVSRFWTSQRDSLYSLSEDGLLITTEHMDSFGVALHLPTGLFLCCDCGFTLQGIISHLRSPAHHKTGVNTPLLDHVARIGPLLNPLRKLEDFVYTEEPQQAIPRLPILANASGCSLCPLTGSTRYINKHIETSPHPESAMPAVRLSGFKCQRLNQGNATRNFRVYDGAAPRNHAGGTLGDKVAAFKWQTYLPNPIPNARMVNPLLNRTKWHEHIGPHHTDVPKFRALVAYPEPAEFPNLKFAVGKYFTKGIEKLDKTEELVLQKLNTHDPDKSGINNTPLHEHHQGDTTVAQYLVPVTRLVAALLRHIAWLPSKRPPLDLEITPELEKTLTRLQTQLKNKSSTHKTLHKLFKLLWHHTWSITAESSVSNRGAWSQGPPAEGSTQAVFASAKLRDFNVSTR
ncbi:hypothetical protein C8R47DRAFT_1084671 [Mycena vitilis]|nr:hypothetical protein C8R47DRAFT_1085124 [Mycena vitilis]KAJ6449597.1 hypothetical protein C8R47DRAFT_1084671 [Mycena vitilis]